MHKGSYLIEGFEVYRLALIDHGPAAQHPLPVAVHALEPTEVDATVPIFGRSVQNHLQAVFDKVGGRSHHALVGCLLDTARADQG